VGDDRIDSRIGAQASDGMVIAPMPGRLIAVPVKAGDVVIKGQTLAILEAMKMEYTLSAPFDGTVQELTARTGALVAEGTVLMQIGKSVP
jgi:3-methylcrotonyl-CoA carboxylase alpha subunit